ncbi:MAG: hypothetical protein N2C14_27060, partial [Planctomycetales bacterium]
LSDVFLATVTAAALISIAQAAQWIDWRGWMTAPVASHWGKNGLLGGVTLVAALAILSEMNTNQKRIAWTIGLLAAAALLSICWFYFRPLSAPCIQGAVGQAVFVCGACWVMYFLGYRLEKPVARDGENNEGENMDDQDGEDENMNEGVPENAEDVENNEDGEQPSPSETETEAPAS